MRSSMFNVRVPMPERGEVFLMNTYTDAQVFVSEDVAALLDRIDREGDAAGLTAEEREALAALAAEGFVVTDRAAERAALDRFFEEVRGDSSELRVTVLTTLQCNFACGYCIQGDHGDYNKTAHKMSPATADRVAAWIVAKLDELAPKRFVLTFFGGEPLLNLRVLYSLSEQLGRACAERGIQQLINIITNGLLLTPELVDRLLPLGLNGIKVTLDGDRETHDRLRPLRGGQGTFTKIIENIRRVAGKCRISIGGNFDQSNADSFPALLDYLRDQDFAPLLSKVAFKPVIRAPEPARPKSVIPLIPVNESGAAGLNGTCMTAAGSGTSSPCDTCGFVDETMGWLREETKRRGFPTVDGVHMGPCEIHRRNACTIGPDGTLYACPGFTSDPSLATGHVARPAVETERATAARFESLAAWRQCGDCAFIPVCGGGCTVAAHTELGDMNAPACHLSSFQSALVSLARDAAEATS